MNNNSFKIALIGYGAMGKAIESVAKEKNIIITNIFDLDSPLTTNNNYEFDVAIDFSSPAAVVENVKILCAMQKNIVIGTTGWQSQLHEITSSCEKYNNGIIYASNFSIGMQIFNKIVANAVQNININNNITTNYDTTNNNYFDIFMHEIHHNNKTDSPSGTAKSLANMILENSNIKKKITTDSLNRKIEADELHITSSRGGNIFGTHTIYIDSLADTIELTHRAKNRIGFASGAIYAAQWIRNKKGIFNFADIL